MENGDTRLWIYTLHLNRWARYEKRILPLLSASEQERAGRFKTPLDRRRFVTARGALKILLARTTGRRPETIGLETGAHGKPQLAGADQTVQFNLSHSRDRILIALCRGRAVGVDIEYLRRRIWVPDLARRFMSPMENATLRPLDSRKKHGQFMRLWTRKEAYLKACGRGVSLPLSDVEVCSPPDEDGIVRVRHAGMGRRTTDWIVSDLAIDPLYAAAVCYEGPPAEIRVEDFDGAQRIPS